MYSMWKEVKMDLIRTCWDIFNFATWLFAVTMRSERLDLYRKYIMSLIQRQQHWDLWDIPLKMNQTGKGMMSDACWEIHWDKASMKMKKWNQTKDFSEAFLFYVTADLNNLFENQRFLSLNKWNISNTGDLPQHA